MMSARRLGTRGSSASARGARRDNLTRSSTGSVPVYGRCPVDISNRMTPRLKMSVRSSTSRPSICSGDMVFNNIRLKKTSVSGLVFLSLALLERP